MEKTLEDKIQIAKNNIESLSSRRANLLDIGLKFIFVTNGGGAVSFLAFLGTSKEMREIPMNYHVLSCFIGGLLLLGIYHALQFQAVDSLHGKLVKNLNDNYDKLDAEIDNVLNQSVLDNNKMANGLHQKASYFAAYGSLSMFFVACVLAIIANGGW